MANRRESALPLAESVHQCFCRSREAAKRLRIIAIALEAAVVAVGLWRFFELPRLPVLPLLIFVATVLEVFFRHLVKTLRIYSQLCRRHSARAYARATEFDAVSTANLRVGLPWLASVLTPFYKGQTLEEYYSFADVAAGELRLRAITAYSAFFSARVLIIWTGLLIIALGFVAAVGIYGLYLLAMSTNTPAALRWEYVEALFSVLWWYATIRLFGTVLTSHHLSSVYQRILDLLQRLPSGTSAIAELVDEYDYHRATGFEAPTIIYRLCRRSIEDKWAIIRPAFLSAHKMIT